MVEFLKFNHRHPWRDAFVASTGLSIFAFAASVLWSTGRHEWAFVLAFAAIWILLSISWSNIDFTEKSGTILASVMDHNFDKLHERIEQLEREIEEMRNRTEGGAAFPAQKG